MEHLICAKNSVLYLISRRSHSIGLHFLRIEDLIVFDYWEIPLVGHHLHLLSEIRANNTEVSMEGSCSVMSNSKINCLNPYHWYSKYNKQHLEAFESFLINFSHCESVSTVWALVLLVLLTFHEASYLTSGGGWGGGYL